MMSSSPSLDRLVSQYYQQVELPSLSLPAEDATLLHPITQHALYNRMFNDSDPALWPLPPAHYRMRVLKLIIARLEQALTNPEEDEINDELLETWGTLLTQPKLPAIEQAQQLTYIKYTAPHSSSSSTLEPTPQVQQPQDSPRTTITSESRGLILSSGTTGFRTWEAALHLGTYLATDSTAARSLIQGKRVIELGAGTGFLAMFCAQHLRPKFVVTTDRELALIEQIQDCAGRNGLYDTPGKFTAGIWEWGTRLDLPGFNDATAGGCSSDREEEGDPPAGDAKDEATGLNFDVALGADLIYDVDLIPLLVATIGDLFTNYGLQQFVISATLRNENTFRTFLTACEAQGFTVEQIPFTSRPEAEQTGFYHSTAIPIHIYRITRSTV
ncbi:protein-lysine N-methyltransferase [Aspergillus saccharolyticus JOP 1030-1]|uniref:Methyltransferase-domain-containing protein n=1 Tax=Aspergillus saccharolyticus JOP 1030-1 TaxID=1450539 RepID=A0A318Z4G5_9EURO|nr:hypothetical protein BP01DRAFT_425763 [Aspergillus saccharolyticus JOP 1030-1]PYH42205.1 hypothetical protein BP01DRAFT_425763 [Aspergillus saccharolyticus JOP 1030-1]